MLVVTSENVAGCRVATTLGECFGIVVRTRGAAGNFFASLRGIFGGEVKTYTRLLEDARKQAMERLVENATAMGANAVIMMRFDSAEIGQNMSEIVAYGTAVVLQRA